MSSYYLDASAAVKAYYEEQGNERVEKILQDDTEIYLSRIGIVEVVAAFFGKTKTGEMRRDQAVYATAELRRDISEEMFQIVEVDPITSDVAVEVAGRHRLRAYDCLQLATALLLHRQRARLDLSPLTFVSSDNDLNAAAAAEGMLVEDPAAS